MAAQNKSYTITFADGWTKVVDNEGGACTLTLSTHDTPGLIAATATDAAPTGTYAAFPLYLYGDGWTNKTLAELWPGITPLYVWFKKDLNDDRSAIINISQAVAV